jgi:hypothetical protein
MSFSFLSINHCMQARVKDQHFLLLEHSAITVDIKTQLIFYDLGDSGGVSIRQISLI